MILHLDFETRSVVDLKKCGADVYARHPSTDILCVGLAFDDDEAVVINPDGTVDVAQALMASTPERPVGFIFSLIGHINRGSTVVAHNANFELAIWNHVGVKKYGWPPLKPEQVICTMAMAYAMALPGSLEKAAAAMGIDKQKDMTGHRIMMQLSQPRDVLPDNTIVWWEHTTHPEKFEKLYAYCKQDIEVERELYKRLMKLSDAERDIWLLDQRINQRGVAVDLKAVKVAIQLVESEKKRLDAEMRAVTEGAVATCTATKQLTDWLRYKGVKVEGVAKADVSDLLCGDVPLDECVRRALHLRQEAAKSSTAKLEAMLMRAAEDGRIRGTTQYHGASTGRWAGRGLQVHNLPRPKLKQEEIEGVFEILGRVR